MVKYNNQNKAYKFIKRYFSEKSLSVRPLKDKEWNLLTDEKEIAKR